MLCPCTCPHAHQHTENNQDVIKFLFLLLVKYSESTKQLEPQTTTKKNKRIYYKKWSAMEMPYTIPFTKKGKARRLPLVEAITVEHHTNQECIVKICLKKNKRR